MVGTSGGWDSGRGEGGRTPNKSHNPVANDHSGGTPYSTVQDTRHSKRHMSISTIILE